jgi:hypothetical protein
MLGTSSPLWQGHAVSLPCTEGWLPAALAQTNNRLRPSLILKGGNCFRKDRTGNPHRYFPPIALRAIVEPEEVSSFEQITKSIGCIFRLLNRLKVEVVASFAEAIILSVASFQLFG